MQMPAATRTFLATPAAAMAAARRIIPGPQRAPARAYERRFRLPPPQSHRQSLFWDRKKTDTNQGHAVDGPNHRGAQPDSHQSADGIHGHGALVLRRLPLATTHTTHPGGGRRERWRNGKGGCASERVGDLGARTEAATGEEERRSARPVPARSSRRALARVRALICSPVSEYTPPTTAGREETSPSGEWTKPRAFTRAPAAPCPGGSSRHPPCRTPAPPLTRGQPASAERTGPKEDAGRVVLRAGHWVAVLNGQIHDFVGKGKGLHGPRGERPPPPSDPQPAWPR